MWHYPIPGVVPNSERLIRYRTCVVGELFVKLLQDDHYIRNIFPEPGRSHTAGRVSHTRLGSSTRHEYSLSTWRSFGLSLREEC